MAFVITEPCIGTCNTACVPVCPVDCIHGPLDKEGMGEEVKGLELDVVVVVRLQGTNAKLAKKILDESDIEIISAETINEAATKAVEIVK